MKTIYNLLTKIEMLRELGDRTCFRELLLDELRASTEALLPTLAETENIYTTAAKFEKCESGEGHWLTREGYKPIYLSWSCDAEAEIESFRRHFTSDFVVIACKRITREFFDGDEDYFIERVGAPTIQVCVYEGLAVEPLSEDEQRIWQPVQQAPATT